MKLTVKTNISKKSQWVAYGGYCTAVVDEKGKEIARINQGEFKEFTYNKIKFKLSDNAEDLFGITTVRYTGFLEFNRQKYHTNYMAGFVNVEIETKKKGGKIDK